MLDSRHLESREQRDGLVQLQGLGVCVGLVEALIFLVFDVEMFCAKLGVVEY